MTWKRFASWSIVAAIALLLLGHVALAARLASLGWGVWLAAAACLAVAVKVFVAWRVIRKRRR